MKPANSPSVIFIFVDGAGIGEETRDNPFFQARLPVLQNLVGFIPSTNHAHAARDNTLLVPLDARLGVPGLPLSGTGQAALLTGLNCSAIHGAHFGPYPPSTVRPILTEKNLFRKLHERGLPVAFANAYPQQYFDYYDAHPGMMAAIASSFRTTGMPLRRIEEVADGVALSADITGERWQTMGFPGVPALTPRMAGKRLAAIAREHAFTMFEYFLTDKAGHKQDMPGAIDVLERLDGFLGGVFEESDAASALVVLTSDHGNVENLNTPSHTFNDVPLIATGAQCMAFSACRSLIDVAPAIMALFPEQPIFSMNE